MKRLTLLLFITLCLPKAWAASAVLTTNASTCPTATNSTALVVKLPQDQGGATLTIAGTFTGTISFYGQGDGNSWTAMNVMPVAATTAVSSATAVGMWQRNISGFTGVCMLASAAMTGSATVTITPSGAAAPATY